MSYLHLGGDVDITASEVVAILDLKSESLSPDSLEFLQIAKEEGFVRDLAKGKAKALILATKNRVFLSPISSWTLKSRAGLAHMLSGEVTGYKIKDGKSEIVENGRHLPD
jgi:hypothetical protein